MKTIPSKLLVLAISITSGLCVSLNLAYEIIVNKEKPKTEQLNENLHSAADSKKSSARHSYAS